jgi:hypothetical protein
MVFSGATISGAGNILSATYDDANLAFTRIDPNIYFYFGDINNY